MAAQMLIEPLSGWILANPSDPSINTLELKDPITPNTLETLPWAISMPEDIYAGSPRNIFQNSTNALSRTTWK
jgi:hypothetical protein